MFVSVLLIPIQTINSLVMNKLGRSMWQSNK